MSNIVKKVNSVTKKSLDSLKTEGPIGFAKRGGKYVYYRQYPERRKKTYKDILFINGCTLPHPSRYRVDHQAEQLLANGLTADSIFHDRLSLEMLSYYRGFIFFRCPMTDMVREFIKLAKENNKTCFFDIDDLVIDQKYTDQIEYVSNMSADDKELYNDGVNRMRETLQMCDFAITTTERLAAELKNYKSKIHINRNVASDEMVAASLKALQATKKNPSKITIGYFSGSITHNEDFEMVLPSLIKLLDQHPNLYLKIVGMLDLPETLKPFADRIINVGFMDWRSMPKELASCDINIAPLVDTIFNEAKSENKWTEAALVKTPTVASNIGAFKKVIKNDETGVLADSDQWFEKLDELIVNDKMRQKIGLAAHKDVLENHTAIYTGSKLTGFIRENLSRNIAFVLPSTDISGGINVVLKHAQILRKNGWDVLLIDAVHKKAANKLKKKYAYRISIPGYLVITKHKTKINASFDTMVATLWSTVAQIKRYPNTINRLYLVQNYETDFYLWGTGKPRMLANATYDDTTNLRYITISLWCKKWLKEKFNKAAKYAPNGIDLANYPFRQRKFNNDHRIQILVEGDSRSEYKNTDEAFRIIEKLDPKRYEISYLSYRREPKKWYRVDHFYNRIAPEEVGKIYSACDILIKTSLLESFSYPPLEMMATGGLNVVVPNDGNVEYLRDGENCLFYQRGNIDDGVLQVELLVKDEQLRAKLIKSGRETAKKYQWANMEEKILSLYK